MGATDNDVNPFVPLHHFTGAEEDFGPLWPSEHKRETQWPGWGDGAPPPSYSRWLVRSPWPGLSVADVTAALWQYLPDDLNSMYNPPVRDPIISEFFRLDRGQVQALSDAYNAEDLAP